MIKYQVRIYVDPSELSLRGSSDITIVHLRFDLRTVRDRHTYFSGGQDVSLCVSVRLGQIWMMSYSNEGVRVIAIESVEKN